VRLAVIGDTQHYRDSEGRICALEPVVNQLDRWAELFDEIVLCAPLDPGPPPPGFGPYRSSNLRIEPLRKAGGNTRVAKLGLLGHIVPWALATRRVARSVDAVHLRCPCNIGLVAIFSTWKAGCKRYAMYAGVWHDYRGEPRFFRLQRKLLASRWFGGPVSVYADRDPSRPHLEPFFSPSYSAADMDRARSGADRKVARIGDPSVRGPWRLVTVGRLTENKNQQTIVRAMPGIVDAGVDAVLDVYGDGPLRPRLEQMAEELGVAERVTFHGSVDHGAVMAAFASADLNLLSTRQEGFGKVLLEGMVHATVPVFGESPVAGEISGDGSRGVVFPADDPDRLADAVVALVADRPRWVSMAQDARRYAASVTLEAFQDRVREMLERQWGVTLRRPAPTEGDA
jgi:glycosyltransferase involved in cell wall biosynthesis